MSGRFVTNIGFFMVVLFLTVFLVERAHMTGGQAGVLVSTFVFSQRGLALLAGWASDRIGAARTLSTGLAIEAAAYASFGLSVRGPGSAQRPTR